MSHACSICIARPECGRCSKDFPCSHLHCASRLEEEHLGGCTAHFHFAIWQHLLLWLGMLKGVGPDATKQMTGIHVAHLGWFVVAWRQVGRRPEPVALASWPRPSHAAAASAPSRVRAGTWAGPWGHTPPGSYSRTHAVQQKLQQVSANSSALVSPTAVA